MTPGSKTSLLASVLLLAGLLSCKNQPPKQFSEGQVLGGQQVSAHTLNIGLDSYTRHCYACHGVDGDGRGPSSPGLRPPPRDFRTATYKFGGAVDGLPHDEDLTRIIKYGLHGTAMHPWDVPDAEIAGIVQYIKTFSPEGEGWRDPDEVIGERIVPTEDPYGAENVEAAIAKGAELYHGFATCQSCHPAYVTKAAIWDYSEAHNKRAEFRENMYLPELKDSDYEVEGVMMTILPPDFTWDPVRSIRPEHSKEDIYRVIGAGIGGTAMPTWKGVIEEEELWALVYYVDSLIVLKDTAGGIELRRSLADQPEFVPPSDEEEGEEGEGSDDAPAEDAPVEDAPAGENGEN